MAAAFVENDKIEKKQKITLYFFSELKYNAPIEEKLSEEERKNGL